MLGSGYNHTQLHPKDPATDLTSQQLEASGLGTDAGALTAAELAGYVLRPYSLNCVEQRSRD